MLFLAIWLVWLDKLDKGEKTKLWHFPLFMLVWSNLHGEFIAGMLAILAYLAGWVWDYLFASEIIQKATGKNLFLVAGLSFFASLLNPAGFGPWKTLLGFVNNSYLMSRMYEARPPDFSQADFLVLLGLLAFSIFILAINRRKIPTSQAFLLTGFSAMSLIAGRNIHLYGIVAPFVLTGAVNEVNEVSFLGRVENSIARIEENLKGVTWPLITIAAFILVIPSAPAQRIYNFDPKTFPVQATDWIARHPQSGKLFNDLNWGGYLALRLWPGQSVFVDSMADVSGELTREYEDVITLAPTWKDILSKYQVEWVVIPTSSHLAEALEYEGWTVHYRDKTAIILRRTTSL
jgi:hypothetical protein